MLDYWWLTLAAAAFLTIFASRITASATLYFAHARDNHLQLTCRQTAWQRSSMVARLASQLNVPVASPAKIEWRVLEVSEVVQESVDCRSYYLVDPYGQSLPDFRPGQYVMVRPALAGAYQATRCYSLSSSPDSRFWRITVKLQEFDEHFKQSNANGLSTWLHQTIGKGDCLLVGGPAGQFYLPSDSTNELVLLAAGVGITPMASIMRWSLEFTPQRAVTLLYQVKDVEHWPLGRTLHGWQADFDSLHVHTYFSRESEATLDVERDRLPGQFHLGKLNGKIASSLSTHRDVDYYLCGPDAWMEQICQQLMASTIEASRIHREFFGPQTAVKNCNNPPASAYQVRFELSEVETNWQDPEQSLWELARANAISLPSGCLNGVCGSCRLKLVSGKVEHDRKLGVELAEGECLPCVARPVSHVTIQA